MKGAASNVFVVQHAPYVARYTAPNPGPKTLSGTHTYVVGKEPGYVIDPGPVDQPHLTAVAASLRATGVSVLAILLSHGHPDHAPGARLLKDLLGVEVVGSRHMLPSEAAAAGVDRYYSDGERFAIGEDQLVVLDAPGHSVDQVAFWLSDARILFSADTILGTGSTLIAPPEGDMTAYMGTLAMMRSLDARLILPGHGPEVTDPTAKIDEYIEHRVAREQQLLNLLSPGRVDIDELVARLYADTDPSLHGLARGSVSAQLQKLLQEGKIEFDGESYWVPGA